MWPQQSDRMHAAQWLYFNQDTATKLSCALSQGGKYARETSTPFHHEQWSLCLYPTLRLVPLKLQASSGPLPGTSEVIVRFLFYSMPSQPLPENHHLYDTVCMAETSFYKKKARGWRCDKYVCGTFLKRANNIKVDVLVGFNELIYLGGDASDASSVWCLHKSHLI